MTTPLPKCSRCDHRVSEEDVQRNRVTDALRMHHNNAHRKHYWEMRAWIGEPVKIATRHLGIESTALK